MAKDKNLKVLDLGLEKHISTVEIMFLVIYDKLNFIPVEITFLIIHEARTLSQLK